MKKGLKTLGIAGLTALTLAGPVKEGIAASNQQTNKNVREVLGENKDTKINKSNTYITSAADFKEQEATDSLDVTQALKEIAQYTDQLVKFYGKDGLNTKVNQIMAEHPDFGKRTIQQQKDIVQQNFSDIINDTGGMLGFIAGLLFTLGMMALNRSTRIK